MPSCTFFGHRDCPDTVQSSLRTIITDLSQNHGVTMFYVGNQGQFDAMARRLLKELECTYAVVLAYLPGNQNGYDDFSDTMLPEGIEAVPPRFAISWRNRWMLDQSDYVVVYVTHNWGGAAKYAEMAKKKGKQVLHVQDTL